MVNAFSLSKWVGFGAKKKLRNIYFVGAMAFTFFIASCTYPLTVSIEQLQPAPNNLPTFVKKVAVVDNVGAFSDYEKNDVFVRLLDTRKVKEELAQHLADTRFFDEVVILDSALNVQQTAADRKMTLPEIERLSREMRVDMIISLEIALAELYSWDGKAGVYSMIRLYTPQSSSPLYEFLDDETIFWNNEITFEKALNEAASCAALLPIPHFIPQWEHVSRTVYGSFKSELRRGCAAYVRQEPERARLFWEQALNVKKRKIQRAAYYNLAVYYETVDSLDQALRCLEQSEKLFKIKKGKISPDSTDEYNALLSYRQLLNHRREQIRRINEQIKR